MSNYEIITCHDYYEFRRACKDMAKAVRRAFDENPRKTDAALLDELVEIIRGTANWAKTVKPQASSQQPQEATERTAQ